VRQAPDIASITAWLDLNKATLGTMAKLAPKLHATLARSIEAAKTQHSPISEIPTPPQGSDELPLAADPETGEYQ